jgi:regulator of replication initiation timing
MNPNNPGFGKIFHDEHSTMDMPAHTAYEIEQYQDRIASLQQENQRLTAENAKLEQRCTHYETLYHAEHEDVERLTAENAALREDAERMKYIDLCGFTFETGTRQFCIKMQLPMDFPGLPLKASTAIDAARGAK